LAIKYNKTPVGITNEASLLKVKILFQLGISLLGTAAKPQRMVSKWTPAKMPV